jgi:hypothetical protein
MSLQEPLAVTHPALFRNFRRLDIRSGCHLPLGMVEKETDSSATSSKAKSKGKARAKEFSWYGFLPEFETGGANPWWKGIDWEEETQSRREIRSLAPREPVTGLAHPGYFWEVLRRYPETRFLIDALLRLSGDELDGEPVEKLIGPALGSVRLSNEVGLNVMSALRVLRENWQHSFDQIPRESKRDWMACYLELWHQVGKWGSVPTKPPAAPDYEGAIMAGQDKAVFDLLIESESPGSCSDCGGLFQEQPLPHMFLKKFAKLRPGIEEYNESVSSFAPGKTKPDTYPWLSFGILKRHLAKHRMVPMALAVDLTKSTDSIMRDLRCLIDDKRKRLGIVVAGRRLRKEAFEMIRRLDHDVRTRAKNIPISRTVKEFENSAGLDLNKFLSRVEAIASESSTADPRAVRSIQESVAYVESNPLSIPKKKGRRKGE